MVTAVPGARSIFASLCGGDCVCPDGGLKGDELVKQLFLLIRFSFKKAVRLPHAAVVDEKQPCAALAALTRKLKDIAHLHKHSMSQLMLIGLKAEASNKDLRFVLLYIPI